MLLLFTLLLTLFPFMNYYFHFWNGFKKRFTGKSPVKFAGIVSDNDDLTGGSVLDEWLGFRPVIFVIPYIVLLQNKHAWTLFGPSEHVFTGNFYCLFSWNRAGNYLSALSSFVCPCAFCHTLAALAKLQHNPHTQITTRQVRLKLCECIHVGGGGGLCVCLCVWYAVYGYAGRFLSRCFTTRLEKESL